MCGLFGVIVTVGIVTPVYHKDLISLRAAGSRTLVLLWRFLHGVPGYADGIIT